MSKRRQFRQQNKLTFTPLGGVEDINRNCYVIEYGQDIVVIDMGLSFPDEDVYGVDYVIPDISYLKTRKERIRGIVITHGHLDHLGALAYTAAELGFPPVYGREFTMLFLKEKLAEFGLDKRVKCTTVEPKTNVQLGSLTLRFIPVTHSIPQASAVQITSPVGTIVYTGDYKFDEAPVSEAKPDYEELERLGREGIDLACMDSTNVFETGKSKTEKEVAVILDRVVKNARGRVIAATFSSLGSRIYSLVEIAKKYNRKIVITGRGMRTMVDLLRLIKYINAPEDILLPEQKMKSLPDERLLILTTGSQGEEMAALSRMSRGEHREVKIKDTDTVILSSSVIPGNQVPVQHLIDDLLRLGAKVIHRSFMDVHTSGHGYQEDMKKMYSLLKPRYVMPVHGWRSFIHGAMYLLGTWGMKRNNILHPETGQKFEFDSGTKTWTKGEKIPCRDIYIDGKTIGETDAGLVEERARLAEEGVMWVVIKAFKDRTFGEPVIGSTGVMNINARQKLMQDIKRNVATILTQSRGGGIKEIKQNIRRTVSKMIESSVGKETIVVVEVV